MWAPSHSFLSIQHCVRPHYLIPPPCLPSLKLKSIPKSPPMCISIHLRHLSQSVYYHYTLGRNINLFQSWWWCLISHDWPHLSSVLLGLEYLFSLLLYPPELPQWNIFLRKKSREFREFWRLLESCLDISPSFKIYKIYKYLKNPIHAYSVTDGEPIPAHIGQEAWHSVDRFHKQLNILNLSQFPPIINLSSFSVNYTGYCSTTLPLCL